MSKKSIIKFAGLGASIIFLMFPAFLFAARGEHRGWSFTLGDFLYTGKYAAITGFALAGILLIWLRKFIRPVRLLFLAAAFIVFCFVFEIHPSPLCATEKPFLMGLRNPFLAFLIVSVVLSFIATKGFCGTACPAGAFQELIFNIPVLKKIKRRRVPFIITNTIRTLLFAIFIVLALGWKSSVYTHINLFEYFHFNFPSEFSVLILFIIPLFIYTVTSLFSYRPFCAYICPVGLWSWLLEQVSLSRIKLNRELCNDCKACEKLSPCRAIYDIMADKKLRSECFLCEKCIDVCPENALTFGVGN